MDCFDHLQIYFGFTYTGGLFLFSGTVPKDFFFSALDTADRMWM